MAEKEKYNKYCTAINKIASKLKKDIDKSSDGTVKMKTKDLAKKMDQEFEKLQPKTLYWMTKPCLFAEDIVTTTAKIEREESLIMRIRNPHDTLPKSLEKFWKKDS